MIITLKDFLIQFIGIWVFEWKISAKHSVEYDSTAPYVHLEPTVFFAGYHFWSRIARATTSSFEQFFISVHVWEAKVNYLQIIGFAIQKQILGFEIPVDNSILVQVLYAKQNLMEEFASLGVRNSLWSHDAVEELTPTCVLHNQVELSLSFNYLIELDHVRVADLFQNFDFSSNPVNIGLVLNFGFF